MPNPPDFRRPRGRAFYGNSQGLSHTGLVLLHYFGYLDPTGAAAPVEDVVEFIESAIQREQDFRRQANSAATRRIPTAARPYRAVLHTAESWGNPDIGSHVIRIIPDRE